MPHKLSNKALAVLAVVRKYPQGIRAQDIADAIQAATPCGRCNGTGEGDHPRYGCEKCYGRGQAIFHYSHAYVALQQLRKRGLVSRRCIRDEWGDELALHAYYPLEANLDDPLEQAFALPAMEGHE